MRGAVNYLQLLQIAMSWLRPENIKHMWTWTFSDGEKKCWSSGNHIKITAILMSKTDPVKLKFQFEIQSWKFNLFPEKVNAKVFKN